MFPADSDTLFPIISTGDANMKLMVIGNGRPVGDFFEGGGTIGIGNTNNLEHYLSCISSFTLPPF